MPYCIECGAKLIPDGAVSCVVCGTTAYNPECEAKKAEERAARERERAERQRKEETERFRKEIMNDMITAEEFFAPPPKPQRKPRMDDMLTAEEFFA